jgi:hypothetical protein
MKELIDAIKKGIDYILLVSELSQVVREKEAAVKSQDFQLAVEIRTKEEELRRQLPTSDELKEVRESLNNIIIVP